MNVLYADGRRGVRCLRIRSSHTCPRFPYAALLRRKNDVSERERLLAERECERERDRAAPRAGLRERECERAAPRAGLRERERRERLCLPYAGHPDAASRC